MQNRVLFLIVFLLFFSCFKSEEQKKQDREEALQLVQQADNLFFKNDFDTALQQYLEAEDLGYEDPVLYYKIAFSYDKGRRDIKKEEKSYSIALDILNNQDNLKDLAACYFHLGYISF